MAQPKTNRPKTGRGGAALRLAAIRQLHVYVSVFVAPSLLFFAFTGALQTFRIPDDKTTPVLIQKLARVHKDDVFALKPARAKKPDAAGRDAGPPRPKPPEAKPPEKPGTTVLKWFFTGVSVAVIVTTLLGLWMALSYNRRKVVVWLILLAGAAAPVLILAL